MKKLLLIHLIVLLRMTSMALPTSLPLQNKDPIANFALNEDDTTRYTHHYLYEEAYLLIADMLEGRRPCLAVVWFGIFSAYTYS